jgi:hypothetical protein
MTACSCSLMCACLVEDTSGPGLGAIHKVAGIVWFGFHTHRVAALQAEANSNAWCSVWLSAAAALEETIQSMVGWGPRLPLAHASAQTVRQPEQQTCLVDHALGLGTAAAHSGASTDALRLIALQVASTQAV